ncbi:hypothetical protein PG989_001253 [Apiospora arundinis]
MQNMSSVFRTIVVHSPPDPGFVVVCVHTRGLSDLVLLVQFISAAISVYNAMPEHPPTSLAIAPYTAFRKNLNRITAGLMYDAASSSEDCVVATSPMVVRCGVPMSRLVTDFHTISPTLLHIPARGIRYTTSLRVVRMRLTEYGVDYHDNQYENLNKNTNQNAITKTVMVKDKNSSE